MEPPFLCHDPQPTLEAVFDSWNIAHLRFRTIAADDQLHSEPLSRLSTNHYAGRYAFLKLMAAELLGPAVTRIIFLDTDMLFNGNIGALWHHFSYMQGQQAIGLVENQSGELWQMVSDKQVAFLSFGFSLLAQD